MDVWDEPEEQGHVVWKGAVAGAMGGLVASWVMNQFQAQLSKAATAMNGDTRHAPQQGDTAHEGESEDATMKTAAAVSETVFGRTLSRDGKKAAGPAVHYAFGASVGALYGALSEHMPQTSVGVGLPFGAAVWLGADEVFVPAFGLSKSPADYPVSTHASALAAHLVYGLTLDLVRRGVRAAL